MSTQPATKTSSPARRPSLMKVPSDGRGEGGYPKVVKPPNGTKVPSVDSLKHCGRMIDDSCLHINSSPFQQPQKQTDSNSSLLLPMATRSGEDISPGTGNTSFNSTPVMVSEDVKMRLRERVQRFYKTYNPDKISYVDYVMQRYKYDEQKLISDLCKKYGPEPASPTSVNNNNDTTAVSSSSILSNKVNNNSSSNMTTPLGKTVILNNELNMPSFTSPQTSDRRSSIVSGTGGVGFDVTSENTTPISNGSFFNNNSSFTRSFKVPQSTSSRSPIHDLPPPATEQVEREERLSSQQQRPQTQEPDQLEKNYPILSKLTGGSPHASGTTPCKEGTTTTSTTCRSETLNRIESSVLKRTGGSTPSNSNNNSFRLPPQPMPDNDSPNRSATTFIRISNTGIGVSYPKSVLEDL